MEKKRKIGGRDEIYGRDDTSAVLKAFSTFSSSLFPHLNDFFPAGSLFSFPLLNRLISLQEFTPKEREREGGPERAVYLLSRQPKTALARLEILISVMKRRGGAGV